MRGIVYEGKSYRSVRSCCTALNISYKKVREYIRLYERARRDPTLAIAWASGSEPFDPKRESITSTMLRHRAKDSLRHREQRFRKNIKAYKRGIDFAFAMR